ncbi:MAG: TIGR03960 family B12-binding radical SAM protein [Acidobacteria bacterium]|nr:TIGR03960 family B12-binding radical SAM protein [Acidobacteriota bacterium]
MPEHTPPPETVRAALDEILPRVVKPARYLGLERNLVRKAWDGVALHVALAFPDTYEIGMSHQGSRILYHLVNRRSDALAERTYAPWVDMAAMMREHGIPLYTLESYTPVREFDIIGITLQSELNYINLPYLLELAGISRWAADRAEDEPIVLGGGPCTANPEPVADFFDAILVGDAEAALDTILDTIRSARQGGASRLELLRRLAGIRGVYVPRFYRYEEHDKSGAWTAIEAVAPLPVHRVWVPHLDAADQPEVPIVPFAEVIQDRLGMEIMRGCTRGCRFCQAGFWYRPVREHDPAVVADRLERQSDETGFEEVGLLSLSSADYSQIAPLVAALAARFQDRRVSVSLPSLRADAFSVNLADAVARVRKSGFTFAPETGSDRLRRVINKTFTNADVLGAAEAAFAKGWNLLKLYAMIGLPTETDDDLFELSTLVRQLVALGQRVRGRRVEVKLSVGSFIPKPWTPFQWEAFGPVEALQRKIALLRDELRRVRGARMTWNDPRQASLEALLSRGSRALSATIARAYELGAVFDGWSDQLDLEAWERACAETGVDVEAQLGPRNVTATLPWDIIEPGVRKGYLKAERRRALNETVTGDCKWGACAHCGIPGDGDDIDLAPATLAAPAAAPARDRVHRKDETDANGSPATPRRARITFAKTGDARFLSHRQLMDALERALRATRIPVRFTGGFNPHIRLSMGPALPLGYEGLGEAFDIDCTAPVREAHLERINAKLPDGLRLTGVTSLLPGAPSLGKLAAAARYRIELPDGAPAPRLAALPEDFKPAVLRWEDLPDGAIRVELNLRQENGPAPTVKALLTALAIPRSDQLLARVTREAVILKPRLKKTAPQEGS